MPAQAADLAKGHPAAVARDDAQLSRRDAAQGGAQARGRWLSVPHPFAVVGNVQAMPHTLSLRGTSNAPSTSGKIAI